MFQIYAIGSNGSGQLGIGHKEDVSVPKPVLDYPGQDSGPISSIKAGGNHALIQHSNTIYCSGDFTTGACGSLSSPDLSNAHFHKLDTFEEDQESSDPELKQIHFCAATWEASVIVLDTGVYSFGIGNKGELGQGEFLFRSSKPQLIKDFPPDGLKIVDLAASVGHVIAVLDNGDAYGWGNGRKGQLGQPAEIVYAPRKIAGVDFKVHRAVCGREFTYLVGEESEGKHVVLGSDKANIVSGTPSTLPPRKQVGASWGSIFILLDDGTLLSWGRDDHGQLAPPGLPRLSQIAIGSEHALGLTVDGKVLAWGWGEHGNCGPGTENGDVKGRWNVVASSEYLPPGSKISGIWAGCATSFICITSTEE